ncbi:MAG: glycosyltransferase [Chloroflexi bacterium HGW-Chloroflexi-10]|nr:MAG: glycosyltransferase [Chloroflexi bacterium HGW-Chloroflexi-10]
MRITILALGSRGDVQPFVPLGKALLVAGHCVRVATFVAFAGMIREAGLDFAPIHGDAQGLLETAVDNNLFTKRTNPFQTMRALRQSYGTLTNSLPQDLSALYDTDLLLNQLPAHLFGGDLADYLSIPWAILTVIPLVRSKFQPLIGFPKLFSSIPGYNMLTYRLGEQMGWQIFRHAVNRLRTKIWHLPALPLRGPYEAIHQQRTPFLCGFSKHVISRPPDWGSHIHTTGWWYPEDPHWQPSANLQHFIDTGPAPVFIGFGSMPVRDPTQTTTMIVEAVRLSGRRAILHAGWAGLGGNLPPEIFPIQYAPYAWLFPRMAAVVHHGGSGTSGFGFRSGIPSIVVPFGFDQFYWGKRATEMGIGPQPIPYRSLTAERLAASIHTAVTDTTIQRCAAELGQKLSAENGVQCAVELIQKL